MVIKMVSYQHKRRHIDQCDRIENPEIHLHMYGKFLTEMQMQFSRERIVVSAVVPKQLDSYICKKKKKMGPIPLPYARINSKLITQLNKKSIKLLKENGEKSL